MFAIVGLVLGFLIFVVLPKDFSCRLGFGDDAHQCGVQLTDIPLAVSPVDCGIGGGIDRVKMRP
jgi:hypothetical protein